MLRIILLILGFFSFFDGVFSATMPFIDVSEKDPYFDGVRDLYDFGMITDDGSHRFRPDEPIERDTFVGLATSVSCHKCLSPTFEDILHYDISPFIDLRKTNPNYYCIAYANETGIVQGYTLSSEWTTTCEDKKAYSSSPFCEKNKTTRIEATAMLLRQWKLWDDTRNSQYMPKRVINDVQGYWQGYAEKWIQAGILTISPEGTVFPDASISRGEFAQMASVMLSYNQCSRWESTNNTVAGAIWVSDANGKAVEKSLFREWDGSILIPIVSTGSWDYSWKAIDRETGVIKIFSSHTLPISYLGPWSWIIELSVIDPITKAIMSHPKSMITIENWWTPQKSGIAIFSDTNNTSPWTPIHLDSLLTSPVPGMVYNWDFGDGKSSNDAKKTEHSFEKPGNYTVIVRATDPSGNISSSSMIITIGNDGKSVPINWISNPLTLNIYSSPNRWDINTDFHFYSDAVGWSGKLSYFWNFWDGNTSQDRDWVNHRYDKVWLYTAELRVRDENGKESVSQIFINVTKEYVSSGTSGTKNPISVIIEANPLQGSVGKTIEFKSLISGWNAKNIIYSWDYGDGTRWSTWWISTHIYSTPWIYTVILIVQDTDGNMSQSEVILSIDGIIDADGDGVNDGEDACISVYWKRENLWCPVIKTLHFYDQVNRKFNGNISSSGNDRDHDGVDDTLDLCPDVLGSIVNNGCPSISLLSGLSENKCFSKELDAHGIMIASPVCITCPCDNTISLMSLARKCDVLFPAILSKDQKNIYSRGGFYQIQ